MAMRAEPSGCYQVIGALAEITGHRIICVHGIRIGSLSKKTSEDSEFARYVPLVVSIHEGVDFRSRYFERLEKSFEQGTGDHRHVQ